MDTDDQIRSKLEVWLASKDNKKMDYGLNFDLYKPLAPKIKDRKEPVSLSRNMKFHKTETWVSEQQAMIAGLSLKDADFVYLDKHYVYLDESLGSQKQNQILKLFKREGGKDWLANRYHPALINPDSGWMISAPHFEMCFIFYKNQYMVMEVPKEHAPGLIELSSRKTYDHRTNDSEGSSPKLVYIG